MLTPLLTSKALCCSRDGLCEQSPAAAPCQSQLQMLQKGPTAARAEPGAAQISGREKLLHHSSWERGVRKSESERSSPAATKVSAREGQEVFQVWSRSSLQPRKGPQRSRAAPGSPWVPHGALQPWRSPWCESRVGSAWRVGPMVWSCTGAMVGELQPVGSMCGISLGRTASGGRDLTWSSGREGPWRSGTDVALWTTTPISLFEGRR